MNPENPPLGEPGEYLKAAEFWAAVFPDGATGDDIKAELADYHFLLEQIPKVYDAVTDGKLTKTNYYASVVIAEYEDSLTRYCERAAEEARNEADGWRELVEDHKAECETQCNYNYAHTDHCQAYRDRDKLCTDCPRYAKIEIPADLLAEALKPNKQSGSEGETP